MTQRFLFAPQIISAAVFSPTTIEVVFDRLITDANYLDAGDFELYVGDERVYLDSVESFRQTQTLQLLVIKLFTPSAPA